MSRYFKKIIANLYIFPCAIHKDFIWGVIPKTKQTQKLLPAALDQKAQIKIAVLGAATNLNDLSELRGNRLEALKGDRPGQYSIRINGQYRICFEWRGNDAYDVEIVDYH